MEWNWKDVDEGRFSRALKEKPVELDRENEVAVFKGDHGRYTCTLSDCDCQDFRIRLKSQQPCKHILALGAALGAYDPQAVALGFEREREKDRLALAYGRYYLFDDPIMSDAEYDALKKKWK